MTQTTMSANGHVDARPTEPCPAWCEYEDTFRGVAEHVGPQLGWGHARSAYLVHRQGRPPILRLESGGDMLEIEDVTARDVRSLAAALLDVCTDLYPTSTVERITE